MLSVASRRSPASLVIYTREPLISYLLAHAEHTRALESLASLVRGLPDDDERLLLLGTLAVRGGKFVPGPATEHALLHFTGTSTEDCDAFLTQLGRVARDDALVRARERGFLPPQRPV